MVWINRGCSVGGLIRTVRITFLQPDLAVLRSWDLEKLCCDVIGPAGSLQNCLRDSWLGSAVCVPAGLDVRMNRLVVRLNERAYHGEVRQPPTHRGGIFLYQPKNLEMSSSIPQLSQNRLSGFQKHFWNLVSLMFVWFSLVLRGVVYVISQISTISQPPLARQQLLNGHNRPIPYSGLTAANCDFNTHCRTPTFTSRMIQLEHKTLLLRPSC